MIAIVPDRDELAQHGISVRGHVFWHPTTSQLYEHALARGDARLAEGGALVVDTGEHTGRSPKDKFVVREPGSESRIWWSDVNADISEDDFERLRDKVTDRLSEGDVYVLDAFAGADPAHRIAVRVISESPWHALFAKTLFIEPTEEELEEMEPEALVLHAPSVAADPDEDGTRSDTFVLLHPSRAEVVIGGTFYAGEIKKSIFTVMNDRLPLEGVFPMHCSANVDDHGRVAVFFGLSGTGKTTLSADPERRLIGDDEHGWSEDGVFNFEGGCYAKVIRLSAEAEPRSTPRHGRSGPCSRTLSWTRAVSSISTTTRRPRTRVRRTSSSRSLTRSPRSALVTRARSCSSQPTRSGFCRRSRD